MKNLVSFIVKCYNQERYISQALEGALSQTYRPLEIVIADDRSKDSSLSIIRKVIADNGFANPTPETIGDSVVQRYGSGDRTVVLIANKTNRGNCGNWQFACSVAKGELFVKADGDDISLPERTCRIVEEWQKAGPNCGMIYHNAVKIDEEGREIGTADKEIFEIKHTLGAVMACTRACYDRFGDCANPNAYDDIVYHRRGIFLGFTEHRFNEKLVKYRIGSGDSTRGKSYFETMHKNVVISSRSIECAVKDLEYFTKHHSDMDMSEFVLRYSREWQQRLAELPMWESNRFSDRWRSFRKTHPVSRLNGVFLIHLILLLPHSLSKTILDFCYRMKG